jgi:hypothetical protein
MIVPGGCKVLSATPIRGAQQSYGVNMAWVGVIPLAVGTTGDMPFQASGATRSVTTAPDHGDFPGPILQALAESLDVREIFASNSLDLSIQDNLGDSHDPQTQIRPLSSVLQETGSKDGERRNPGTFQTREAAVKHEREIQFFKRR